MAYDVVFSPQALQHLPDLETYLAERFYPGNAERYVQSIIEACKRLGRVPEPGIKREDLAPGLRVTGFERRVALYFTVSENRVFIVSVIYGGKTFIKSQQLL